MKKFLCLVMACVCILSTTVFAAETSLKDIKGTKYEDAVEMLVSFGIVNGFEDSTYRPNDSVTRVQLAKMLTLAMGVSEDEVKAASKKFLNFSDVLSSHWGYGYIKIASDRGLVNGYPDGTFAPDAKVSYAEAITMFLRVLEYEDALDKTLTWPNNYMIYADEELDLFRNVGEFKAANKAPRGDIAILLWNTLRTGIGEIVAQNDKGLIYGPGTPMISKYLNYIYIENAEVRDIEFSDDLKTAKVTLKEKDMPSQKITVSAEDALEMFGREVSLLLNEDTKEILQHDYDTDYRVVKGEVSNITESKIYISSRATGYNIPNKDNILLYGIEYIDDAVEVIMLVDGNNAKYCVATGASEAFPALVNNTNVEISDDSFGIRIRKPGVTRGGDDYYLANENAWPKKDSIILYYINSEDLLVVLDEVKYSDAGEITSLTKDTIKVTGSGTFDLDGEYSVFYIGSSSMKEGYIEDIDKAKDTAIVATYAMHTYIFVYQDDLIDSLDPEIADLLYDLEDAIEDALECDEALYTQESFAKLMEEVEYAKKLNYNSSKTKLKNAVIDIEDAIADLDDEDLSKTEKKIVALKKELRAYVNDECAEVIEDEFDYTDDSYEYFEDMYEEAIDVLAMSDALLAEVEDAFDDLMDAVEDLEEVD